MFSQKKNLIFKINSFETLLIPDLQFPEKMSKCQKVLLFHLEGLPDEIILKIVSLLDINGVLQCGQVSTRLRAISNDKSLWLKLNLSQRDVPYDFIEKVIQNGCEYLNLSFSYVNGGKKSDMPWKLKCLVLHQTFLLERKLEPPKGVLENCHYLQKLSVDNLRLNSFDIEQICQNGETLQTLSLEGCNIDFSHRTELIQKLFTKCSLLSELNMHRGVGSYIGEKGLLDTHLSALFDNLTPNILKLSLCAQDCVDDRHVNTLVRRCNKITELDLSFTAITNDSVKSIIENLRSLEKLDLGCTNVDFSTLLQLKSIPSLKMLHCFGHEEHTENLKNLKLQLPHISINEDYIYINVW